MKSKITKRLVDVTKACGGRPVFVFDNELAGFVLKATPTGHRTYQVRYRMGGRSTTLKTYALGKHGPLTAEQARRLAETIIGDVRRGIDPAAKGRVRGRRPAALSLWLRCRQSSSLFMARPSSSLGP